MGKVALAGSKNVRDLGGIAVEEGRVRERLLLRGGNLHALTKRDASLLRDQYGLALVIDLRTATERDEKPDAEIPCVENIHLPIFAESAAGITHERSTKKLSNTDERIPDLNALYAHMVSDACLENLAACVNAIVDSAIENRTVLFHCTEGKDRTGLISALLLAMLGASREAIMSDYTATNVVVARKAKRYSFLARLAGRKSTAEKLQAVFTAREEYLDSAFAKILNDWDDMERFADQGLKVDSVRLQVFRNAAIVRQA